MIDIALIMVCQDLRREIKYFIPCFAIIFGLPDAIFLRVAVLANKPYAAVFQFLHVVNVGEANPGINGLFQETPHCLPSGLLRLVSLAAAASGPFSASIRCFSASFAATSAEGSNNQRCCQQKPCRPP